MYEGERRKFVRIRQQDIVNYTVLSQFKNRRKLTQDLSLGGARFISDNFIPIHAILKLEIKLMDTPKMINAVARVVWIREIFDDENFEVGVEFMDISTEDLAFLNEHLSKPRES